MEISTNKWEGRLSIIHLLRQQQQRAARQRNATTSYGIPSDAWDDGMAFSVTCGINLSKIVIRYLSLWVS